MRLEDLPPLQNLTLLANLPSILAHGICAKGEIARGALPFESIANEDVQDRRAVKRIHGLPVHEAACLYFNARNPMLFSRLDRLDEIAILLVDPAVLQRPGVRVTDQNAAREKSRHYPIPEGLAYLDWELIYADEWHADDARQSARRKGIACAEVLVPGRVPPEYLRGLRVGSPRAYEAAQPVRGSLEVVLDEWLFFHAGRSRA